MSSENVCHGKSNRYYAWNYFSYRMKMNDIELKSTATAMSLQFGNSYYCGLRASNGQIVSYGSVEFRSWSLVELCYAR
jgi:hypothetical protein